MPEQLDRMLSVTPARGWIALVVILAVATAVGAWSVVGEVATYVEAHGFLLNRGGKVVYAVAAGHGRLREIAVAVGDDIEKDAVVALIINEEIAARRVTALALAAERTRALDALKTAVARESRSVHANNARRRKQLAELDATALEMLELARANFENSQRLFEKHIVARVHLERTQQEFNEARRALLDLSRDQGDLEAEEIKYRNDNAARIREMMREVEAARHEARRLKPSWRRR